MKLLKTHNWDNWNNHHFVIFRPQGDIIITRLSFSKETKLYMSHSIWRKPSFIHRYRRTSWYSTERYAAYRILHMLCCWHGTRKSASWKWPNDHFFSFKFLLNTLNSSGSLPNSDTTIFCLLPVKRSYFFLNPPRKISLLKLFTFEGHYNC